MLDERLGQIVTATREGALGEIRLAWWREALAALPKAPPGEPLLAALAAMVDNGLDAGMMSRLPDGWAALLEPLPLSEDALSRFAEDRGVTLFMLGAAILGEGADQRCRPAGAGWALGDLARHVSDPETATRARAMAGKRLAIITGRWPRVLRPLAVLAALARRDARKAEAQGGPMRLARAVWAGLTRS